MGDRIFDSEGQCSTDPFSFVLNPFILGGERKKEKKKNAARTKQTRQDKTKTMETQLCLNDLPFDVLFDIMLYLDPQDVCHVACASRAFYEVTKEDWLWRCLLERDFGDSNGVEGMDTIRREECDLTKSSSAARETNAQRMWWRFYKSAYGGQQWSQPRWQYGGKAPIEPRQCHAAARLGDYLCVYAGFSRDMDLHVCDTRTREWTQCQIARAEEGPARANLLYGHTMVPVSPTQLLVYGGMRMPGYRGELATCHLLVLDEEAVDRWHWEAVQATNAPPGRAYHAAAYDAAHQTVYVFGGIAGQGNCGDLYALNLNTKHWKHVVANSGESPSPRMGHSMHIHRGVLYIVGGTTGHSCQGGGEDLKDVHGFHLQSLRWRQLTTCPFPSGIGRRHGADLLGSTLVVVGGGAPSTNDVTLLNLETMEWRQISPTGRPPSKRVSLSASFVNNVLHVFGGSLRFDGLSRELWLLHPELLLADEAQAQAEDEDEMDVDYDDDEDVDDGAELDLRDPRVRMMLQQMMQAGVVPQGLFQMFADQGSDEEDEDDEG